MRIVSKPAALASCIFAIATAGSAFRPSSSAAPMYIRSLPSAWAGTARAAKAQSNAMKGRRCGKRKTRVRLRRRVSASVRTAPEGVNTELSRSQDPSSGGGLAEPRTDIDKSKDCVAKALTAGGPGKLATFRTNPRVIGGPVTPPGPLFTSCAAVAWPFAAGLGWTGGLTLRKPAESAPCQAGGVPLPRQGRRGPVRGQGQVVTTARPVLLSAEPGHADGDPAASGPRRRHRGDRHPERGRGAAPRAEPRQAPPAALQRPAPRRQVVPVHSRHRGGRIPARDVHARTPSSRGRLLRAVREREEGSGDPGCAEPSLSVPALRGPEAGTALGHSLSRLPHRSLPGALRRLRDRGGLSRDHRAGDRVPVREHRADPA